MYKHSYADLDPYNAFYCIVSLEGVISCLIFMYKYVYSMLNFSLVCKYVNICMFIK